MITQIFRSFIPAGAFCSLLATILSFSACRKDEAPFPDVVDIPVAFQLGLQEKLQPGDKPFQILLSSVEVLDCENYLIDHIYERRGQRISLKLNDFILADPCIPGEGHAETLIDIGILHPGNYPLTISLRDNIENTGTLSVTSDSYTVKMETSYGIWATPNPLFRIPDQTIWGGVFPGADSLAYLAENFIEDLEALTSSVQLPAESFGPFLIGNNGKVFLLSPAAPGEGITFVRQFEGDRNDLIDLASDYRTAGGPGFTVLLFDEDGFIY